MILICSKCSDVGGILIDLDGDTLTLFCRIHKDVLLEIDNLPPTVLKNFKELGTIEGGP